MMNVIDYNACNSCVDKYKYSRAAMLAIFESVINYCVL